MFIQTEDTPNPQPNARGASGVAAGPSGRETLGERRPGDRADGNQFSGNRPDGNQNGSGVGQNQNQNQNQNQDSKPRVEPAKVVTAEKAEEAKNLMSKIAASTMGSGEPAPKTLETVLEALPEATGNAPAKRKSRRVSSGGEITPGADK